MSPSRWAPVAAAAAALAVVAGAALLARSGPASAPESPPVLRIGNAGGERATLTESGFVMGGGYRLTGPLPGGPVEARARDLPKQAASEADVRALATALGASDPVRDGSGWRAGDPEYAGELVVSDEPGNPWTWISACGRYTELPTDLGAPWTSPAPPDLSVSSGSRIPSVGAVSGTVRMLSCAGGPFPVVTEAEAMAGTTRVRQALGLIDAPARLEGRTLIVDPVVDGLPTQGLSTFLHLSGGYPSAVTGWLSTGGEGALYPLRSAQVAFDELPEFDPGTPCEIGCHEGIAITRARLGLSRMSLDVLAAEAAGRPIPQVLVPAWFFSVEGAPQPLVVVAIAERFLDRSVGSTEPPAGDDPTGIEPAPGDDPTVIEPAPGADPHVTDPGPGELPQSGVPRAPGTAEPSPAAPSTQPSPPSQTAGPDRESFTFDGAYADPDPDVLVVRYGDSGSCPSEQVRHEVVEEPTRITVTLTRTPMPPDRICTADYQAKLVRVALVEPLGGREVIDGSRGEPVPVSTGPPPFG